MRDDLAGQRRDRLQVAEHAALDLDPRDELLDEHLLVVPEPELNRRREAALVVHLRDPDGGAETGGLDEDRVAVRVPRLVAEPERDVARHRDARVAHDRLELVLVHCERRAEDARADVGDAGELEQPLHRAVLAEGPVQHRDHDVDLAERLRHLRGRHGQRLGGGAGR